MQASIYLSSLNARVQASVYREGKGYVSAQPTHGPKSLFLWQVGLCYNLPTSAELVWTEVVLILSGLSS